MPKNLCEGQNLGWVNCVIFIDRMTGLRFEEPFNWQMLVDEEEFKE